MDQGAAALGLVLRDLLPPAGRADLLPAGAHLDFAALADRRGYESIWVPEGRGREAIAKVGAMAAATSRVRLGTGILPIFGRPPALAAMAAATLSDLSGGRFILGLGVGHPAVIEAGYGLDYQRPLEAMREYVEIVRRVLSGAPVHVHGHVFRVDDFQIEWPPRHLVPIYVAALGEKMLRLAGEVADGVILNWMTPERVRWSADLVRDAARAAGRDPASVQVACYVRAIVTDDPAPAWSVVRRLLATYAAMPAYARMFDAAGFAPAIASMTAAWASGGVDAAARATPEALLYKMAVVGPAGFCREQLGRYRAAGADTVAAYAVPVGADPVASMWATIEGLMAGS